MRYNVDEANIEVHVRRLIIPSLALLFVLGCSQPQETSPSATAPPPQHEPTLDELKSHADKLLDQIASTNYRTREDATRQLCTLLKESGKKRDVLLKHLQERYEETEDAEVCHRIEAVFHFCLKCQAQFVRLRELGDYSLPIKSVAFSPDGTLLASGDCNNIIALWNPCTGESLRRITGHTHIVNSVVFSADGKFLASASDDDTICIWNPCTGERLRILRCTDSVNWVAFSPDGNLLASADNNETVQLWNPHTGESVRTLAGHSFYVNSVTFSPNGKLLVSASDDNSVRIWNARTGQCLHVLEGHTGDVRSVAFSPDGKLLASGSSDETIRIWSVDTGACLRMLQHTELVYCVEFSPDGKLLALVGGEDNTIWIWNALNGEVLNELKGHTRDVWTVKFSPDGRLLASGDVDGYIIIWGIPEE